MTGNLCESQWRKLTEQVVRRSQEEKLRHYLRKVVLPNSVYYRKLFQEHGLEAESIRTLDDLRRIPFTRKADLQNTAEAPQRVREFILIPDPKELARRPETIFRAMLRGRKFVKAELESEYRPIFMTFTT